MHSSWIRAFALIAVAALLANAQCYGTCGSAAYGSTQTHSTNSCHHQKSSHENDAPCPHQHSDFTGPAVGITKVTVAAATPILPMFEADSSAGVVESQFLSQVLIGSPPGSSHFCPTVSVLRI